jgi:cob(I)alamin adenosyltransferase
MKIYTKTGDAGTTGLWGGQRVDKDAVRVESYGQVDELNALLGVARTLNGGADVEMDALLERIQNELFVLGADLATPGETTRIERVNEAYTTRLEEEIDRLDVELEPLRQFILPGGSPLAAHLHLVRTVCRRAERSVVKLAHVETINPAVLIYLNRLSDWFFMLARVANSRAGQSDVPWNSPA